MIDRGQALIDELESQTNALTRISNSEFGRLRTQFDSQRLVFNSTRIRPPPWFDTRINERLRNFKAQEILENWTYPTGKSLELLCIKLSIRQIKSRQILRSGGVIGRRSTLFKKAFR